MNKIILITGAPGAGKTTIGRRIAQHFSKSLHVKLDELRGSVVSGQAVPARGWTDEMTIQARLARTTACTMAKLYAVNGYDVVIDDVCIPNSLPINMLTCLTLAQPTPYASIKSC